MSLTGQGGERGLTLIELAVVLALIGIVGAAIGGTLVRQQRFYRGAGETLYARESVRDALEVLSVDIRGLAVADTVRLLADSAMEFFATIGTSVVCGSQTGGEVTIPGVNPAGNTLTSLVTQPDTGDLAFLYDARGKVWHRARISEFGPAPIGSGCAESTALGKPEGSAFAATLSETLSEPLSPELKAGAPLRFARRGRYSLYRASDGDWYLGYRRCNATDPPQCGAVQPLSGPYDPYDPNPARTGVLFEYFDASGARVGSGSSPLSLARVRLSVRSKSIHRLGDAGREWTPGDSSVVSIAIRNAAW